MACSTSATVFFHPAAGVDDTIDGRRADTGAGRHVSHARATFEQALIAAAGFHGIPSV
jgi:hypothetical protein